jgi:hypothetical protein
MLNERLLRVLSLRSTGDIPDDRSLHSLTVCDVRRSRMRRFCAAWGRFDETVSAEIYG